jgi:hypothetical protein
MLGDSSWYRLLSRHSFIIDDLELYYSYTKMSSDAARLLLSHIQLRRNTAKSGQASADGISKNHWPKGCPCQSSEQPDVLYRAQGAVMP